MPASPAQPSSANEGAIVGPIQSENGWHVVKIDRIQREGGKTVAEARAEISAKLAADKRKAAIENIVNTVQDAIDEGGSFTEAAAAGKLAIVETPLDHRPTVARAPIPATRFRRNWPRR